MLYLKIKEILQYVGIRSPHGFLMRVFGYRKTKAYNLVNNKTRNVNLDDLGEICHMLNCTPNDLLWWDNSKKLKAHEGHALMLNLTKPHKHPEWKYVHGGLPIVRLGSSKCVKFPFLKIGCA
jgi:DNA-binding Xre family transcriptional regulator